MRLAYENPKPFIPGQSVTWICETSRGSTAPIQVRVVNVVNDRVVIRVVKQGAVYFKSVPLSSVYKTTSV